MRAGAKFHTGGTKLCRHLGQKILGHIAVHQQAFQRIAHARALHLAVKNNLRRCVQIGIRINISVAHALEVLEHGHGGSLGHGAHKALAAARNYNINIAVELAQGVDGLVSGNGYKLGGIGGQSRLGQRIAQGLGKGDV